MRLPFLPCLDSGLPNSRCRTAEFDEAAWAVEPSPGGWNERVGSVPAQASPRGQVPPTAMSAAGPQGQAAVILHHTGVASQLLQSTYAKAALALDQVVCRPSGPNA